uniref:Sugar transporter SWEET1 n=1 Tax=Ditylum brightwellii TaxID=49249 RepID=A0A7S1ZF27_9STRA|mmetsp:Transcript_30595/g.45594  ORF Transcript_30595/g.45594 Transcript_30595/m.45594 type:complete len:236 (+) Transcript_30595:137-844(+)
MSEPDIYVEAVMRSDLPAWVTACGHLAPLMAIVVFLAPIPTMQQINREKTVGGKPLLPYSSMIANGFIWTVYGFLKSEPKIMAPNSIGLLLGTYYFTAFRRHVSIGAANLPGTTSQHRNGLVIFITFILLVAATMTKDLAVELIGKLGVLICMIMFASPLSTMKVVIETKSADSIPLPFTIACVINCVMWSVMGVLDMNDFNVYFPNLVGLAAGLAQLVLKGLYGNRKSSDGEND